MLKSDLHNAMNKLYGKQIVLAQWAAKRAALYRFITIDDFSLRSMVKLKTAACAKTKRLVKNIKQDANYTKFAGKRHKTDSQRNVNELK